VQKGEEADSLNEGDALVDLREMWYESSKPEGQFSVSAQHRAFERRAVNFSGKMRGV
jgi:hypothetical protein